MSPHDAWLTYGGRPCLDFVNTLRDRATVPRETLLAPGDVLRWLDFAGLLTEGVRTEPAQDRALEAARQLRASVDRAVLAAAGGQLPARADVAALNEAAATLPRPAPQLAVVHGELTAAPTTVPVRDTAAGLALIAHDAVELLLSPEVRRVRICGADRCALRFVDRSPAHNRRWCSMERCGNRTKARRHQARAREA